MKATLKFLTISLIVQSTFIYSKTKQIKSIYGDDNRQDLFNVEDPLIHQQATAVGGLMAKWHLKDSEDPNLFRVSAINLKDNGVCEEERFSNQYVAPVCTGFLVGPNLVMTAGHCATKYFCEKYVWAFNYRYQHNDQEQDLFIKKAHVSTCEKVIYRIEKNPFKGGNDIGLIKLTKSIPIEPLKLNLKRKVKKNAGLYMIGHPSGLPLKLTDDGKTTKVKKWYFKHNLDSFGGNSGSPVFNAKTKLVEGVLSRGRADYFTPEGKNCKMAKRYSKSQRKLINLSEHASFVRNIGKTLKKNNVPAY
ncbi:trypsin-like peptidase domain-containing protein [Bacteriovoracaceae bacterium]|nr:trypsin-like peptidase domain-containing protein [Bacteriovoracaceae bacterium]